MQYLLNFLSGCWDWVVAAYSYVVTKIVLAIWLIATAIYIIIKIAIWCLQGATSFFTQMAELFNSHLTGSGISGGGSTIAVPDIPYFAWQGLKILNSMFPVDTFAEMVAALILAWTLALMAMAVIRISTVAQW